MRRLVKTKLTPARALLRKAKVGLAASGRAFPAWVDAAERGTSFSAASVTPRVRDGLVLRLVAKKKKIGSAGRTSDARGAR